MVTEDLDALKSALRALGFEPSRRLGQNFLFDKNLLDAVVRDAALAPGERVLEIGPGPGWLTRRLAAAAAHVTALEVDPRIAAHLRREFAGAANLTIVEGDALAGSKTGLHDAIRAELRRGCVIVANLPYSVASPLLANIAREPALPARAVVMIQKEVADRLAADPGTAEYGPLTVVVRAAFAVRALRDLPPAVFSPRPKVTSTLVALTPLAERVEDDLRPRLDAVIRAAFGERRKMFAPRLQALLPPGTDARAVLAALGRDATVRGEALPVAELLQLARLVSPQPARGR